MENPYLRTILKQGKEFFLFGNRRQRKISFSYFKQHVLTANDYQPIFFLSTGRTGTKLFTRLIQQDRNFMPFHAPQPELIAQSKILYEKYQLTYCYEDVNTIASQLFMAAREELLYLTYLHGKQYVETNNRITFLAPAILKAIPHARFVYLHRHPGEFIRSGVRRQWYSGNRPHDIGRLSPLQGSQEYEQWVNWGALERIAWLWNTTNLFVENFLDKLAPHQFFRFNFNELHLKNVKGLMQFMGCQVSEAAIEGALKNPVNQQKEGGFPYYEQWLEKDKERVRKLCPLAFEYGYDL